MMIRNSTVLGGLSALALVLVSPVAAQQSPIIESEAHNFRMVTVAEGLEHPWSIAFLPDGDMLVTEKPGRLRIIRDGVLQPEPIGGVPEVLFRSQGGLLDVVLHPDFASNRLVYVSYSKPNADGSEATTAVIRGRLGGNTLENVEEIFEAKAWSTTGGHYGARLAFDPEGYLFITVGDRQAPPRGDLESHPAQDLSNHQGTVVRLHDDGRVPEDNPFVGRADVLPEIWSYGHRNPQGLAVDQETGEVWVTEHGPQGGDELNRVVKGANFGWPVIGYGVNYGGVKLHESAAREGMEQPIQYWTPSIGTSGLMLYTGDRFPEWKGSFFAGAMANPQLARLPLTDDGKRIGRMERPPLLLGTRIRDVRQGPDGLIYLALDDRPNGGVTRVVRLEPAES